MLSVFFLLKINECAAHFLLLVKYFCIRNYKYFSKNRKMKRLISYFSFFLIKYVYIHIYLNQGEKERESYYK